MYRGKLRYLLFFIGVLLQMPEIRLGLHKVAETLTYSWVFVFAGNVFPLKMEVRVDC